MRALRGAVATPPIMPILSIILITLGLDICTWVAGAAAGLISCGALALLFFFFPLL